jgi:hypothetical protein
LATVRSVIAKRPAAARPVAPTYQAVAVPTKTGGPATGRSFLAARLIAPTYQAAAVLTCAAPQAVRMCRAGLVLMLSSGLMLLKAWVKEQPNVTSARGGTRVRKDLGHRPQVVFVAAVQAPHTSLLVALMAAAAVVAAAVADLIIANCWSVTSYLLRHSIPSWRIE